MGYEFRVTIARDDGSDVEVTGEVTLANRRYPAWGDDEEFDIDAPADLTEAERDRAYEAARHALQNEEPYYVEDGGDR